MFKKQNTILRDEEALLKSHFKAIKVVDSRTIILPEHLKTTYRGSGGSASDAAVKVQLQLDLLTGSFIKCDISEAVSNDADYLPALEKSIEEKELHLKDLGYFNLNHINILENSGAYYISKLKSTSAIYIKNDNPEINAKGNIIKSYIYKKVDIQEIAEPLAEGETIEIPDIYIGKDKLKTKLILTKLTQECKLNREKIFQGEIVLIRFLSKIIESIMKYGVKSKKKGKKTSFEIIESVKISEDELEILVV